MLFRSVRLIDETGENVGVISRRDALSRAENANLDLVQMGEADGIAIAKIMDFGKFLYEKKKQDNEAKKHQKVIQIKEVKFRPNIGEQDYQIKMRRAESFLKTGKRVKFTLEFRGREMANMTEVGRAMFKKISEEVQGFDLGTLVEEKEQRGKRVWSKIFYIKGR